jgi:hypothetical protein
VTASFGATPDGQCALYLDADGSRITRLSAYIESCTGVRVSAYPAERRAVIHLGERFAESVELFVPAPELARLIDALNDTYTRIAAEPAGQVPGALAGSDGPAVHLPSARSPRIAWAERRRPAGLRLAPSRPGACPQPLHGVRRQS